MENSPEEVTSKTLGQNFRAYVRQIFDVKSEVDFETTSDNIKNDVVFRGFNIWILMLSILICSIGLNLNSTAIVIGAMLISPLMGPITGLGFAVATFDKELLSSALKNLATALIISILVSFLFFKIAPAGLNQSEILSRTKPGVMDLLVASFGGFAGILAAARNVKTNVIPGVAIATALMPPLCTAGFGLATGNMEFFLGAFYLFFINSVFISLSALLVIRYLKFPIVSYVDKSTRSRGRFYIIAFAVLVSVPSVFLYTKALRQSLFEFRARKFVDEVINTNSRHAEHINLYYTDTSQQISAWVYGEEILQPEKDSLQLSLDYHDLSNTQLIIKNMGDYEAYQKIFEIKESEITQQSTTVEQLSNKLLETNETLLKYQQNVVLPDKLKISVTSLNQEVNVLFTTVETVECLWAIKQIDSSTISYPTFVVNWKTSKAKNKVDEANKLDSWLKLRYKQQFDSIRVVDVYP